MSMAKKMLTVLTSLAVLASLSAIWLPAAADADEPEPWMLYTFNSANGDDTGTAANDATAHGTPEFGTKTNSEAGPAGKYLVVDDNDNFFTAAGSAFDFGTDAFTASFWVKFAADYPNNIGERVFETGLWGEGDTGFVIALNRDGGGNASISAAVAGTGSGNDFAGTWGFTSFANDLFAGAWHLLTIVFDQPNKRYTIYLDGVSVGVKPYARDNLSADTNRNDIGIGAFYNESDASLVMRPTYCLDDVAFYKTALTASQVSAYYTANTTAPAPSSQPDTESTLTDSLTGISVTGLGLNGAELYAASVLSGTAYDRLQAEYQSLDNFILYSLHVEKDATPMEFSSNVTVRLGIPEKFSDTSTLRIIRVNEDGSFATLPSTIQNGFIEFSTDQLGSIAIVNTSVSAASSQPQTASTPATGDTAGTIPFIVLTIACGGIATFAYVKSTKHAR